MANPEAVIDLVAKATRFDATMKQVESILGRVRQKMLAVSRAAKFMLVGQIAAFTLAVKAASEYEETLSKFEAVFKDQAGAAKQWADEMSKAMNRSTVSLLGFLARLQDTFVPFGFAREEARKLSQQVTQLGVDIASFNNIADADAVRDLTTALTGSHETVKKFGVIINEVTLKEALLKMGIVGGTKAATEQEKVLARLNILMAATSDAQGDAIRTSGSLANQIRGLKAAFLDLSTQLGDIFIPLVTTIVTRVNRLILGVQQWSEAHAELIKKVVLTVIGLTAFMAIISPLDELGKVLVLTYKAAAFAIGLFGAAIHAVQVKGMIGAITIMIAKLGILTGAFMTAKASALAFAANPVVIAIALVAAALVSVALAARQAKKELAEAEEASLRMAAVIREHYGATEEDVQKFSDAQTKALGKEAQQFRERIELLKEQRKAMEDQLAGFGMRVQRGDLPIVRGIQENIAILDAQIETYSKLAEAASAAARIRIDAAKRAAAAEAEFYGVTQTSQDKKLVAMEMELNVLALTDRQIAALKLTTEGYNEAQTREIMAIYDKVAAEKASIAATEKGIEASLAATAAIRDKGKSLDEEADSIRKQMRALKEGVSLREIELFDLQNVENFKDRATEILALMKQQRVLEKEKADEDKAKGTRALSTGFETTLTALERISAAAAAPRPAETAQIQTAQNTSRMASTQQEQLQETKIGNQTLGQVAAALGDAEAGPATFAR